MQSSLTTSGVPAVQVPVMVAAELQDSLLVVMHDLQRLEGLLSHATDNLLDIAIANINPADIQTVCIRVLGHFQYRGDNNLIKRWSDGRFFFDFQSSHGQQM